MRSCRDICAFLLAKGGLYKVYNDNLLYHGCVPLAEDGSLKETDVYGKKYRGRELYDALDAYVRKGFFALDKKGAGGWKGYHVVHLASSGLTAFREE